MLKIEVGKTYRGKKARPNFRGHYDDRTVFEIKDGRVMWDGMTAKGAYLPTCKLETFQRWAGRVIQPAEGA